MLFLSADETIEYANLHGIARWMVIGRPDGWWPVYTLDGPVNPLPEPRRVDISLVHGEQLPQKSPTSVPAACRNQPQPRGQ
jgi:hypothetical protein